MATLQRRGIGALLLATLSLHALAADTAKPVLIQLGNVYAETTLDTLTQACAARFPDASAAWRQAQTDWRTRHAAALSEVRDLTRKLEAASRTAPRGVGLVTSDEMVAFMHQGPMLVLSELARRPDSEARLSCQSMLPHLQDDAETRRTLDGARRDAQRALDEIAAASR